MKRIMIALTAVLLLVTGVSARGGDIKEGLKSTGQEVQKDLEPLGEDVDYVGRTAVYGIGAVVIAPFRFVQDILNAFFQGTSGEKLWDHTN